MRILDGTANLTQDNMACYIEACNEVVNFLNNKLYEYCLMNNIDYLISFRVKDAKGIKEKMARKGHISDIIGIRIVFCELGLGVLSNPINGSNILREIDKILPSYTKKALINEYSLSCESDINGNNIYIYNFIEYLIKCGVILYKEKDYIKKPKESGYQSYHCVITASNGYEVEIQIRNYLQHIFAEWEHTFYKEKMAQYNEPNTEILFSSATIKNKKLVKKI